MLEAPYLWLLLGALCLAMEALGVSGVGFLFAGLGAIATAMAAHWLIFDTAPGQIACFCAATTLWAVLLWAPMRRWRTPSGKGYSNMVGDRARVAEGGLRKGHTGDVLWSATRMKARLAQDASVSELPGGSDVVIAAVEGNTLIVRPA